VATGQAACSHSYLHPQGSRGGLRLACCWPAGCGLTPASTSCHVRRSIGPGLSMNLTLQPLHRPNPGRGRGRCWRLVLRPAGRSAGGRTPSVRSAVWRGMSRPPPFGLAAQRLVAIRCPLIYRCWPNRGERLGSVSAHLASATSCMSRSAPGALRACQAWLPALELAL